MKRVVPTFVAALSAGFCQGTALAQDSYARCGDLPPVVAEMRERILTTLETGSIQDLVAVADAGIFTASYGGGDTAEYWLQLAADGTDIREVAGTLLTLDCTVAASDDTLYYTWPSAVDLPYADLTETERSVLAKLHGSGDLESVYVEGTEIGYYIGWSLVIAEDGDWIALVAGD